MDKAKAAITDFMGKSGHHDTTVHESVAPAVQHETVKPHHHENITTAVDKEVHQDHYHRTVQPVKDREILPEKHEAKLGAVQHREFDNRDHEHTKRGLAEQQAAFKDERVVHDATRTESVAPTVGGEHVHHHIHETIQPVVHKETIQPHVTHTTVPIHEVHHNAATHHETTQLPVMDIKDFKTKGGVLGGREERYDGFEGEPKNIGGTLGNMMHGKHSKAHQSDAANREVHQSSMHGDFDPVDGANTRNAAGTHPHGTHSHAKGGAVGGAVQGSGLDRGVDAPRGTDGYTNRKGDGITGDRHTHTTGSGLTGDRHNTTDHRTTTNTTTGTTTNTTTKPSMMDKLNPKVDANGDGKAGFMK